VTEQNLGELLRQSLQTVAGELSSRAIRIVTEFADDLPLVRLDARAMKHVLINLIQTEAQSMTSGGSLCIRTLSHDGSRAGLPSPTAVAPTNGCRRTVVAEIEARANVGSETNLDGGGRDAKNDFGMVVARKIIQLYGGNVQSARTNGTARHTISFNS
jgi:hypothetical protein